MAIALDDLLVSLRINPPVPDDLAVELRRRISVADALVNRYAPGAPSDIRDEAVVLIVGYLHDRPSAPQHGFAYVFRSSGAEPLLAPWRAPNLGGANVVVGPTGQASPFITARVDGHEIVLVAADGTEVHLDLPVTAGGSLAAADRTALDGAVQRESVAVSDRDLTFADTEGNPGRVRLPGLPVNDGARFAGNADTLAFGGDGVSVQAAGSVLTVTIPGAATEHLSVKDEGVTLGTENSVDELDIRGAGVTATRTGNTVTITVSGVDTTSVQGVAAALGRVAQLEQFEGALRRSTTLAAAVSITQGLSNAAERITGNPKVPADDGDRELTLKVANGLVHRFDVGTLLAKPAVSQGAQLTDANSVGIVEGDDTWRIARDGAGNLLFASDNIGTYAVTITDSQIDLQPDARLSAAKSIRQLIADAIAAIPAPSGGGGTIGAGAVQPSNLRFVSGTRVGGRAVFLNDAGTRFKGVTLAGLTELFAGNVAGLAITNSSAANVTTNFASIGTFDLDDYTTGELHLEFAVTMNTPSQLTLGLTSDTDTTWRHADVVFLSTLKASSVFVLGGMVEGVKAAEVDVYNGATKVGAAALYLVRNAANLLGYVFDYRGAARSDSFNLAGRLDLSFMPADAAPAPSGGGGAAGGRGALIATATMPTVGRPGTAFLSGVRFTVESAFAGAAADKYGTAFSGATLQVPSSLPSNQPGFVLVAKLGGVEQASSYFAWGPLPAGASERNAGSANTLAEFYLLPLPSSSSAARSVNLAQERNLRIGKDNLSFHGAGQALHSSITVEVYEWLA